MIKLSIDNYTVKRESETPPSNSSIGNGTFELIYGTTTTMLREQMDNVDTNASA